MTRPIGDQQRLLHVRHRLPDRHGAVEHHVHRDRRRNLSAQRRQLRPDRVHNGNRVRVRLLLDRQHDGAPPVEPGRDLVVLDAVVDSRDFIEFHRRPVAPRDDHLTVIAQPCSSCADACRRHVLLGTVQGADGRGRIGARHRSADIFQRQAARRRSFGIGLHAHGEFLRAVDQHLRNARNLRQRLRDGDVAIFVDGRKRQRLRIQRDEENGKLSRIHFAECRRNDHLDRQTALGDGQARSERPARRRRCCG
jgi:hypothetical protein